MSSSIVYHAVGLLLPPRMTGYGEHLYLVAAQIGDNNCYEVSANGRQGRRSRSWSALHFGTHDDVLADAIRLAGGFEGGGLKLDRYRGGDVPPERYIGRARRLLNDASKNDLSFGARPYRDGYISARLTRRVPKGDDRFSTEEICWDEREQVRAFIAQMLTDAKRGRAWNYVRVSGPELR